MKIKNLIFILFIFIISCDKKNVIQNPNAEKWKVLSLELVDLAIRNDTIPTPTVQTYSCLAYAFAITNGWDDKETKKYLNKSYSIIDSLGYGLGYAWDAFQDKTINSKYTNYTVTMTDHVGYTFMEGYKKGKIPKEKLIHLIQSILKVPYADNLKNGKCWAYSDSPNDIVGCVHNINIGLAYFFEDVTKAGFIEFDLKENIKEIIDREVSSYISEKNNYLYWDRSKSLTDQNHLAYQAWCMIQLSDIKANEIGRSIISDISQNKQKDISSLIGQLRVLPYSESESEYLYNVLKQLSENKENEYKEIGTYTMKNPRILSQLALWSAKYYEHLKGN